MEIGLVDAAAAERQRSEHMVDRRQKVVVEGGAGIGHLPDYLVRPAVASGHLVRVLPDVIAATIEVHALYPSHRSLSAKVRVFIDALGEHVRVTSSAKSH